MVQGESVQLVLIPWPVMGHVQIVEFAKLIIDRQNLLPRGKTISFTVLVTKLPDYIDTVSSSFADVLCATASATPRLNFVLLPPTTPTPEWSSSTRGYFMHNLILSQKSNIADFLRSRRQNVVGLVVDMLCTPIIEVADDLGLPSYVFVTSPATFLSTMLHFQTLQDEQDCDIPELRKAESDVHIPCFARPVPPEVLSQVFVDKQSWRERFLTYARDYRRAKGIIVNTFAELEPHALDSFLVESAYGSGVIPPIYSVGPILNWDHKGSSSAAVAWLDGQPQGSVVFLCFGSQGSLPEEQVHELAIGLERSGKRFLWSLRRQSPSDKSATFPVEYDNYDRVLPEGFLDRTTEIGRVVGWVPQLEVLSHPAVGGFVSHCGWNSVLESVWCGVPIATWPLHAEQQMNAFELVRELGLAVEITLSYLERGSEGVVVTAEEVERGIREVMKEGGIGSEVRSRVREMSEKSRGSVVDGGSSYIALNTFIDHVTNYVSTS